MTTPPAPLDDSGDEPAGYSPAAAVTDTEGAYGSVSVPSPGSPGSTSGNQAQSAATADTAGTATSGTGAAMPGGSVSDQIPWAASGQAGGATGPGPLAWSGYAVTETNPSQYGWPQGSPDTEGVYGGAKPTQAPTAQSPYAWTPASTAYGAQGSLDTQVSGGSDLVPSMYTSPNPYRSPSSAVAASIKDTTLTDIIGSQVTAAPLTDASYAAQTLDTSYIGSPAAPAALSKQTDTFTSTAASTKYYLSQQGITPLSSVVLKDATRTTTLVSGTDYTLTTALTGPDTSAYFMLTAGTNYTAGDTVTVTYTYGTPQYFDSNLPATQNISVTDILALSQVPAQLLAWGVTTAAASITVVDVTQNNTALTYNTDYTVTQVTAPSTPGSSYSETPPVTYRIAWKPTSTIAKLGDVIAVTYSYATAVPAAPAVGSATAHTDAITSFTATPFAFTSTGVVTPPAALSVLDTTNGKTLILNTDYTVTMSSSGSTLAYSIARVSTSPNSTSGDHVSVTYSTGNAAYFTSGPVIPVNHGVWVPWTPPSGVTEVDFYLVQSTDLGTQYVPKSGQPANYGQPAPSGGSVYGQPDYRTDVFTGLQPPAAPVPTTSASTGTILAGVYTVKVTYVNASGESAGSVSGTVTTTGTTSTITIPSPAANANATGWYAYVSQVNATTLTRQQAAGSPTALGTALTLTAPPTTTGANPPAAAVRTMTLSRQGVVTPPGQLIVRDLTSVQNDPLQPDASVLIYNYDYTVAQTGIGPWATCTISLLSTSVNAKPSDNFSVSYWWDTMGAVPLTAVADTVIAAASAAALAHADVATPLPQLVVYDTTISKSLAYGADFTAAYDGEGPASTVTLTLITTGPAGAGATDHLTVYYSYGVVVGTVFTQGLRTNDVPIVTPSGGTRPAQFQFSVAAGNRAGLGPFSGWSDRAAPLNFNSPQPGFQGTTTTFTTVDPANTVNPVYTPSGAVKAGTGIGM